MQTHLRDQEPEVPAAGAKNSAHSLTEQLQSFFQGHQAGADALLREILPKLHEIAIRELSRERYVASVSATELIQEIWLRNISKASWQIGNRGHFYAIASLAMRRVLVDLARSRIAQRRGGLEAPLPLAEATTLSSEKTDARQIVEIGILMERLEEVDSDAARVVDMHYFGGFTLKEISQSTGLTFRQVRTRWERGLKWLKIHLKGSGAHV